MIVISFAVNFLFSCKDDRIIVAETGGKILYDSDIPDIFPEGTSYEDSIRLLETYANGWTRKQLILSEAEVSLSESKKDIAYQLEDYRTSLLIYRYEQEYVNRHLDTLITQEEVQTFYDENKENLKLLNPLAKAVFIKIPTSSPHLKEIKELYRSKDEVNVRDLADLCIQVADKYDSFNDQWVDFSVITKLLPQSSQIYESLMEKQKYIEDKDDIYTYLVNVRGYISRGGYAPIDYEHKVIKSIILNTRRQKLLSELEQRIYEDAIKREKVNIRINE
ncbi:MAG: hypothetical protein LBG19_11585 [Prevotellaceae bacterium]|nr:hypothetical protein [Prevotellaceae bacterium]